MATIYVIMEGFELEEVKLVRQQWGISRNGRKPDGAIPHGSKRPTGHELLFWRRNNDAIQGISIGYICASSHRLNRGQVAETTKLEYGRDKGDFRWTMKCVDIERNTHGESTLLGRH
ncbi:hypothetical protein L195_g039102 [Trifolium pratense]|uniref:Uncharacterized protein n=1 Tax=Trifolium pratense TaxID=57577 RepID=A0A2K3LX09_TRIPR|nr:hypothetical protein L195_g039102 [Trifolium pratense]